MLSEKNQMVFPLFFMFFPDSALFRGVKKRRTIADFTGLFRNLVFCLFFEIDILRFPRYNNAYD